MKNNYNGDWPVICQVCDLRWWASQIIKRWDGVLTCPNCYDPKASFFKSPPVVKDKETVPFSNPPGTYDLDVVSINGHATFRSWLNLPSEIDWT